MERRRRRDFRPDHGGASRAGLPTGALLLRDEARATTWLHPRSGEPVNSGHMIRSDLPRGWEEGFTNDGASFFIKMGNCCSRDPSRGAGHELVPIKRHTTWPATAKVVANVEDHEFSTWDLTGDASMLSHSALLFREGEEPVFISHTRLDSPDIIPSLCELAPQLIFSPHLSVIPALKPTAPSLRTTAFRHPVSGQISAENMDFILQEQPQGASLLSKPAVELLSSTSVSEASTAITSSTVDTTSKGSRPSGRVHSFGKREQAIKRNPNVPVVVRGWLYKQDSSGMRLWKRKWFVLADFCLFYYKELCDWLAG
ncbi:hypothetical protein F7725_023252 [Dissostichus mawsoni]|uniref:PH domain-containing protein n=1 Tax=Dissostichus mawsoni TaxID=36200 RepID=A0A7J5Z328_DISMA|nr:hypothetical protein F7725_023252 [Dissostichus mawsoni]